MLARPQCQGKEITTIVIMGSEEEFPKEGERKEGTLYVQSKRLFLKEYQHINKDGMVCSPGTAPELLSAEYNVAINLGETCYATLKQPLIIKIAYGKAAPPLMAYASNLTYNFNGSDGYNVVVNEGAPDLDYLRRLPPILSSVLTGQVIPAFDQQLLKLDNDISCKQFDMKSLFDDKDYIEKGLFGGAQTKSITDFFSVESVVIEQKDADKKQENITIIDSVKAIGSLFLEEAEEAKKAKLAKKAEEAREEKSPSLIPTAKTPFLRQDNISLEDFTNICEKIPGFNEFKKLVNALKAIKNSKYSDKERETVNKAAVALESALRWNKRWEEFKPYCYAILGVLGVAAFAVVGAVVSPILAIGSVAGGLFCAYKTRQVLRDPQHLERLLRAEKSKKGAAILTAIVSSRPA